MPTRSLVLAAHSSAVSGTSFLLTCPAGYTLIVKEVRVMNWGGASVSHRLFIYRPSRPAGVNLSWGDVTTSEVVTFPGWTCLEPGDQLVLEQTGDSRFDVWVSGTSLPGVQVLPPAAGQLPGGVPIG